MAARKRADKTKPALSSADPVCTHPQLMMLTYASGPNQGEHKTLFWCPDCGALCWRTYVDKQGRDVWAYPSPGVR